MSRVLSRDQSREVDQIAIEQFHLPGVVLMENAGRNCAEQILQLSPAGQILILAGKGNNGGDGFVIARHLHNAGLNVKLLVFATPEDYSGEAESNWRIITAMQLPAVSNATAADLSQSLAELPESSLIVDALLGTGIRGQVRSPFDEIITAVNAYRDDHPHAIVFAVDVPSGLDCDTGLPCGVAIKADQTATFVTLKQGFVTGDGPGYTGTTHVIDIGIPPALLDRLTAE
ncbi:MAG: NAD(P)H-hydrate epimerase [Rubinisphaera brasiliensis]|uniref:NAD(P)H-hydrate epimerase n=1 Tax=Rubinisphaera brasiliensis TaxID=119 RepID=UPI003918D897